MLIPQNNRSVCQQCSHFLMPPTVFCPCCGARCALPWPGRQDRTGFSDPVTPVVPTLQPTFTPLVVELLLNILGIYGVGWLMINNIGIGMLLLMCSILLWPMVILFTVFTLGLVLLCLGPVVIGAAVCNALLLYHAIQRKRRNMAP